MLPTVHVDQMTLAPWFGNIDGDDALIVSLVVSLDSRDDQVKRLMAGDYFMLTTSYVQEMLPLVALSEERIKKRLAHLAKIGLLDLRVAFNKRTGHRTRYVKPSKLYYNAQRKAQRAADEARKIRPEQEQEVVARAREYRVENDPIQYRVESDPMLGSKTTQDQLKDQKRGDDLSTASPPPLMAAGEDARPGASKKDSAPNCPSCGNPLNYPSWPRCEHCSAPLPGLVPREAVNA